MSPEIEDGGLYPSTAIVEPMQLECEDLPTPTLPHADGGKDAWLVLTGCFVLEALVWGYGIDTFLFKRGLS
jgi:hypothetical protein